MTTPKQNEEAGLTDAKVMDVALRARDSMESELERDILSNVHVSVIGNFVRAILSAQANDAKAQEDAKRYRFMRDDMDCNDIEYWAWCEDADFNEDKFIDEKMAAHARWEKERDAAIQGMQTGSGE